MNISDIRLILVEQQNLIYVLASVYDVKLTSFALQ